MREVQHIRGLAWKCTQLFEVAKVLLKRGGVVGAWSYLRAGCHTECFQSQKRVVRTLLDKAAVHNIPAPDRQTRHGTHFAEMHHIGQCQ
jgi:hypothetical protein